MLFVISAFETTNDQVLTILKKNHTADDLKSAVELSLENSIDIRPTWMPFSPWTEIKDLINIINLIENYKLRETVAPIQLTIKTTDTKKLPDTYQARKLISICYRRF